MTESTKIGTAFRPFTDTGRIGLFLLRLLGCLRPTLSLLTSTLQQTFLVGARSLVIIMICGFFVGMVLALQAINALEQFGASDQVSLLVGKSLFRELGPVLTALLFAGRAGTSIAAEIGLMKATSQLDAMELMAIDPVQRIALPRFLAGVLSVPLLTAMFNALAILGAVVFSLGVEQTSIRRLLRQGFPRRHLEERGIRRPGQPGCRLFRLSCAPNRGRGRHGHDQHGSAELGAGAGFRFHHDLVLHLNEQTGAANASKLQGRDSFGHIPAVGYSRHDLAGDEGYELRPGNRP